MKEAGSTASRDMRVLSPRIDPPDRADDVLVVVGGVIPPDDVPTLKEMGAAAVFLPGTVIAEAAQELLRNLSDRLGH